jgi:hypothetical protein
MFGNFPKPKFVMTPCYIIQYCSGASNFKFEKLGEFETKLEYIFGGISAPDMELFYEKNRK